ncbi:membrane protein required for colicin V production [Tranquillimonas rosea]|uniref:Membrane protein required for colicin V production n=1 Tax=Tranquillimonas rosea TaxID=641238 RepID=A0A1H9V3F4_9RHOB|nr:CvpA family protein [Tranquillimonas rosea]SES16276.1 membrane protein required for colicin V production [Tranquillimonas rosea]
MEGFTVVDGIVAAVIVISAILAYSRGFVREAMSIAGWIAAAIVAFIFAPTVEPLMTELPVIGGFLGDSCELSIIAAFAAVFAVALVIVSLFTPLFSSAVRDSALGGLDQGLGFLFGAARGILLVAVAFVVYDRVVTTDGVESVDNSRTATIFARSQDTIDEQIPEDAPGWIVRRYEQLVSSCEI